jgi:hypothetical protein
MRIQTRWALAIGALLGVAGPALAQSSTFGDLRGSVSSEEGALPGVSVTVASPALQGTRTTTSGDNGSYLLKYLPPGEYDVTFELQGFQTVKSSVKVSGAQEVVLDQAMRLADVSEEIVVTGTYDTISASGPAATTIAYEETLEKLALNRNIREAVLLTPGVGSTGPGQTTATGASGGQITIAGGQSYENLFLVNGVVVNENLRGQPFDLFIEDAIEETTTSVSGVSAEYGRFAGGVVNTITRSGGNQFSGSLRANLSNDDWISETALSPERADDLNETYEATLGGFLWKDRVWFFGAGRDFEKTSNAQTVVTNQVYPRGDDQQRYEGKLTLSPAEGHRLVGTYQEIDHLELGNRFTANIMDTASQTPRELPQELRAINYTGVLTSNFFVEGQYSEREFAFVGSGSRFTDRIGGTLFVDQVTLFRWHSPTFCGVCTPEERNNENLLAKASYFLTTESAGSHDLVAGYDTFTDVRAANNHQSGSDFRILISGTRVGGDGSTLFPIFNPGGTTISSSTTWIQWNPIFLETQGSDFVTNSYFVNDRWRLNDRWSFNLGVRYDENDGRDQEGKLVAKDSRVSPRLSASFDPRADGNLIFNASYGQYVTAIANNVADATSLGGNPAQLQWFYRGPAINVTGNDVPADAALQMLWDWFDSVGGTDNTAFLRQVIIPGGTTAIRDGSLESPYTEEISLGVTKRLGTRGLVRADLVRREGHDFYAQRADLSTGSVITPTGTRANFTLIENEDDLLERAYDGLHTQFQYRLSERLNVGGSWTWSHARGNWDGETANNATVSSDVAGQGPRSFPEYKDLEWNNPRGDLAIDQRHRVRLYGIWEILSSERHSLNASVLQSYYSGRPYGAVGLVDTRANAGAPAGLVVNPGYAAPPASVVYYFTERDAFETPDITSTDLSLNYSFYLKAAGRDLETFVQTDVFNVFDEDGFINVNQGIQTAVNSSAMQRFNPFTTQPVEGVHWRKPPVAGRPQDTTFGRPANEFDYQTPRTYRLSVGVRF